MKKILILVCLFAFCFLSCHNVDSDPKKGAEEFFKEMSNYAKSNNYDEAYDCLNRYWDAYSKSDQLNLFCWALRDELSTSKYNHINTFINRIDIEKYPLFLDFKARYIAAGEVFDEFVLDAAIKNVGTISMFGGSGECRMTYDMNTNEVRVNLKTNQPIEGVQSVDKQLAIEGLRIAFSNNSELLQLMTEAKASLSFLYSDNSHNIEIAKFSASEVKDMFVHPIQNEKRKDMLLENYIAKTNSILPNQIAEGVTYKRVEIKGNYVVQEYIIDESQYDIKDIEAMLITHKYDKVEDPIERNEYDIYTSHEKGLKVEYYTKGNKPAFVITYSVDELKKLLKH